MDETIKIAKSAVAFFFLFFLHGFSIGNGQQGISYNYSITTVQNNAPLDFTGDI